MAGIRQKSGKGGNPNPRTDHLKEYQFKPGQSGNPSGRPKNVMKDFQRKQFGAMSHEDKIAFLESVAPIERWKMAEGNPVNESDITTGGEPISINITFEDGGEVSD